MAEEAACISPNQYHPASIVAARIRQGSNWGTVVRASTIVMIAFAVVFGLLAVFVAQSCLNSQADQRMKSLEAQNKAKPVVTSTIVVASKPLRFGSDLSQQNLREIAWPQEA